MEFFGKGPQVSLSTFVVDFGSVAALEPATRKLTLRNESPIPAHLIDAVVKCHLTTQKLVTCYR